MRHIFEAVILSSVISGNFAFEECGNLIEISMSWKTTIYIDEQAFRDTAVRDKTLA